MEIANALFEPCTTLRVVWKMHGSTAPVVPTQNRIDHLPHPSNAQAWSATLMPRAAKNRGAWQCIKASFNNQSISAPHLSRSSLPPAQQSKAPWWTATGPRLLDRSRPGRSNTVKSQVPGEALDLDALRLRSGAVSLGHQDAYFSARGHTYKPPPIAQVSHPSSMTTYQKTATSTRS